MNVQQVSQTLEEITTERAQIEGEASAYREKLASIDERLKLLEGAERSLRFLLGQPSPQLPLEAPPEEAPARRELPRTVDAVYHFLRMRSKTWYTAGAIMDKLSEGGLLDPNLKQPYGTVLDAARRLAASKDEIVRQKRKGKVFFSFRPEKLPDHDPPGDARKGDLLGIPRPGGKEPPMT